MIQAGTPAFYRATLALCLGSFIVFANLYITQPLFPLLRELFELSALQATWSLSLAMLTLGISLLVYGPLSDSLGRRRIMLLTLAGASLLTLLVPLVDNYAGFLVLRMLQGFLLGGVPAIAIAYMGDEFERPALLLAVGLYISANSLGGISGRLLGGGMTDLAGWHSAFYLVGGLSILGVLIFAWLLPASRQFQPRPLRLRTMISDLGGHLKNPRLLGAYLIGGLNFFIFSNQYSYITYVLSDSPFYLPPTLLGLLFLTYLSGTLSAAISGKLSLRFGPPLCMLGGIVMLMLGTLVTLNLSLNAIIGGLLINSLGFFICHSVCSAWVNHHAGQARASASSLYLLFYYLGASAGGFYLDPFWQAARWPGVVLGSLLVLLITAALALRLYYRQRRDSVVGQVLT
ncbi:MAG: YNFM family putative membrane transporter [Motiliproteus sp.]|jgi:YNFM family putative membrane transporter